MVDSPTALRFSISATFTAEPLAPVLSFWANRLRTPFEVRFAPFNQIFQTLLDPAGEFSSNARGVNVVLFRTEDLGETSQVEANLRHLTDTVKQSHFAVPLIVCLCPDSPDNSTSVDARGMLRSGLAETRGIYVIDDQDVARMYPVADWHQEAGDRLGRIPYTDAYFAALGTVLARWAHAMYRNPFKVIVLDCDHTLWNGICGEDGPDGVVLDEPRRALQEFMRAQRDAGMLLTIASKNNEADVAETFRRNPHMPLRLEDFVATRIDWESKANSVESLAEELNLGLDSFIFVDDNPKECAEVSDALPEVLALPLPADDSGFASFLNGVWAFDHPVITAEDRKRSALYAKELAFHHERRKSTSLRDFHASLGLQVRIEQSTAEQMSRIAQLTQRTNQFNFTSVRRQESEIEAMIAAGYECMSVHVSDRFGDYGLTGVLIFQSSENALHVDTFLLSCRVLGRGVEHRVLAWLGLEALRRGISRVQLRLSFTPKNQPARQFLVQAMSDCLVESDDGFMCSVPADVLSGLKLPVNDSVLVERKVVQPKRGVLERIDFASIAESLGTADQVLDAMRTESANRQALAFDPGMSEIERGLVEIWADLLQRADIERESNFFDLGGHSLLAVLLLLRVKEKFEVELSIDDVYAGSLTLADLALRIEQLQLGQLDPEEYAALLAEIESMPDEQVRELLAREGQQEA